jgi:pyruvate kinase
MKENPRPTRAEVSDVALAIVQGADAVMLSAETASGKYPVKAVEMMAKIAKEYDMMARNYLDETIESYDSVYAHPISLFVTRAAYHAQKTVGARAILTPTESGYTARKVSRFKPKCMIIALTRDKSVFRQLALSWGVVPIFDPREYSSKDEYIRDLIRLVVSKGMVSRDDRVVVTAGHKLHIHGHTNHLGIYEVSDML